MFQCPICHRNQLQIENSLELPPDCAWDEITLQVISCRYCRFRTLAVYKASRRGALDDETVHHYGFFMAPNSVREVAAMLQYCRQPRNARCQCAVHQALGRRNEEGCWLELSEYPHDGTFDLQRASVNDKS